MPLAHLQLERFRCIAEARLDPDSIFNAISRFARERDARLARQRAMLAD